MANSLEKNSLSGASLFARWLESHRDEITEENIAETLGISVPTLWRYKNGRTEPDIKKGLLIEELTNGAVPIAAWAID